MVSGERLKNLHITFFALDLGAIVTGVTGLALVNSNNTFNVMFFSLIIAILRVKFWLDDETYFDDIAKDLLPRGVPFWIGFIFGLVSWIMWAIAGISVINLEQASLLMIATLIFSFFWIVTSMIQEGAYHEQTWWLVFDVIYIFFFFLMYNRTSAWNPFNQSLELYTIVVNIGLFFTVLFDLSVSRILEVLRHNKTSGG